MEFYKLPFGFGQALTQNFNALNAYCALPEEKKQALAEKARQASTQEEMHRLAESLLH